MSTQTIDSVPLLDLDAQYRTIQDEVKEAVNEVMESQQFIMGPQVEELEKQVAQYSNTQHAIGCASGSDALLLSLMAIDTGPGDYVITTPYTFFATAGAIARLGATPIFLDIDPITYNIDPEEVRMFLEGKHPLSSRFEASPDDIKALIPVHLYGQMADMDPLNELSEEYDFHVIEDAAQAIGAEYKGRRAGSIGDFGCFSFFPSKNLGGYGDGGMITTDDDELAEKLRVLRVHGSKPKYHHKIVGVNSRLDTVQAAILKVKLQYLDEWSDARRERAQYYRTLFEQAGLTTEAEAQDPCGEDESMLAHHILPPVEVEGDPARNGRHVYHQFVIRSSSRDVIQSQLKEADIGHSIYYPVPLHEQECFSHLEYTAGDCPSSHCASLQTLALPIFPELTRNQQEYVVDQIQKAIANGS